MAARLGNVIFWASMALAILIIGVGVQNHLNGETFPLDRLALAALTLVAGRATKYVLAGN